MTDTNDIPHINISDTDAALPPCPITGRPAKRHVQSFSLELLNELWKAAGAGDVAHLFPAIRTIKLYESDTGLYFFDPLIAGDESFYQRFYSLHNVYKLMRPHRSIGSEFQCAAAHVTNDARVLDVGCGNGEFGEFVQHARYCGLDPYAGPDASDKVLRETVEQHLESARASYDVVTAFQVIEHVVNPRAFAEQLTALLRPGGILILGAPLHPSPLTEIPNFLINAPPHHLTWWNIPAFEALVGSLGLTSVEISVLPYSPHETFVYWMHRFSFVRTTTSPNERYFGHRWAWHLNLASSYLLARLAARWLPLPKTGLSCNVILIARTPE